MADEPAYIRNLRLVARAEPDAKHLKALERQLYRSNSDRAVVVLLGSFVETRLERLLASKMRKNMNSAERKRVFDYEGPLGTFSAKTAMAYALSIIGPQTRSDLDLVRILRNEFAHSRIPLTFRTAEIKEACAHLKLVDYSASFVPRVYLEAVPRRGLKAATDKKNARTRFLTECNTLLYRLDLAMRGPQEGDIAFPNDDPVP